MLCYRQNSIIYSCQNNGWVSIWFTTGFSSLCLNKCSKCLFAKLLTPISLTFPYFFNSTKAFQVSSLSYAFLGSSLLKFIEKGQWISNKSRYPHPIFYIILRQASRASLYPCSFANVLLVINSFSLGIFFVFKTFWIYS